MTSAHADRPWWATKSWLALGFVVCTVLGAAAGILLPIASEQRISQEQRALTQEVANATQTIENQNRKVAVSRLLFEHYFGKDASEQRAVITYLRYQFPADLSKKSLQAILVLEGKEDVKRDVTRSVAAIKRVRRPTLDEAIRQERKGFTALIRGDLSDAKAAFDAAYKAYPTYHNVDEISRRVLSTTAVERYEASSQIERDARLRGVLNEILTAYSWGIPSDLRPRLENAASSGAVE